MMVHAFDVVTGEEQKGKRGAAAGFPHGKLHAVITPPFCGPLIECFSIVSSVTVATSTTLYVSICNLVKKKTCRFLNQAGRKS